MILVNELRGVRARVVMPKTGAWWVDVDIDLDTVPVAPSGPAIATLGTNPLRGTVDARHTGRFGAKGKVRIVAGGGGWNKPVPALHLHNDAGVFSTAVFAAVGAAVGEVVTELGPPTPFGPDYAEFRGAASSVFAGLDWWMDPTGATFVGPRPPLPLPPIAEVLSWDPTSKVAEIASDVLILPGMTIVDPLRIGTATIDDVEQVFDDNGARAIAFCSTPDLAGAASSALLASPPASPGTKLVQALSALAQHAAQTKRLRSYSYRVVLQGVDGRLNLQSTELKGDAPPFLRLIDVWGGVPGLSVKLAPAARVLVTFVNGDPSKPKIIGFDPKGPPPLEVAIDGVRVVAGLGVHPAALSDGVITAIQGLLLALSSAVGANPAGVAAATAALTAIPSTNLFADGA